MPDLLISVIIPALNEANGIAPVLRAVEAQDEPHEIIVVDGGSADATVDIAAHWARVIAAPRGRAVQMNRGAAAARGEILLFLHADTLLPPGALAHVRRSIAEGSEAGAFRLAFDAPTPLLRLYSYCTYFPLPRLCFGDRALYVRRDVFSSVGGYPEIPLFEDLELVRALWPRGRFRFHSTCVTTSGRRYRSNGPLRQQLRNSYLWLRYVLGSDLVKLQHLYEYD